MSAKPLLVVLGATGNQGGSVLSQFLSLSPSPYVLRGVTRDPSSPKSISLASLGVEMVAADFDNPASLDAAFKGASAIFTVTDFWHLFADPSQREKAATAGQGIGVFNREYEAQQNRNIIDAAAKVTTLERFVFSSLPNPNVLSGGKYPHVYHFEGKAIGVEYGRSTHPKLWEKTNVFYAGFYLENWFGLMGGLFRPKLNKSKDTLVLTMEERLLSVPLPLFSAIDDTGALVAALLHVAPGQKLLGVREWLSIRDVVNILAQVLGKIVKFVEASEGFVTGDTDLDKDNMDMIGFCVELGYDGGKVDKSIVKPTDLDMPVQLGSVKEWCRKQDWDSILDIE